MENEAAFRSGFAALLGRPNVGKSTLMNRIVGQKIAITSPKPQTTRNRIQTVYTSDEGQIIFLDTPGIHKAKNKLGEYMDAVAQRTAADADVILWLVEPDTRIGEGDMRIARKLSNVNVPVILVINKTDKVRRDQILKVIDAFRSVCDLAEIVPCSALKGEGVDDLLQTIFKYLPYGPRYYDEDMVTDQPQREIAAELIREKALRCLGEEVPHGIAVTIESMKKRPGRDLADIEATIICERESHKGIIIGHKGAMLRKIGSYARPDIEDMLGMKVNLRLWVKVRKGWRDSDITMKNFGYNPKDI